MPKSRSRPKQQTIAPRRSGFRWRRAAAGWAEFLRNLSLLFLGAPFVEPLLSGAALNLERATIGLSVGIALLIGSSILDNERRD